MKKVLVFGEILYDLFEEKAEVGGAPFNFAAHFASLGGDAELVSAVGKDALAHMAQIELDKKKVGRKYVARTDLPTGYCQVTLKDGSPTYKLAEGVAFDHIPLPQIDEHFDALYFGTLAQRSVSSQNTLYRLLEGSYEDVFLDVNVRKPFYSRNLLEKSIEKATMMKISREEAFVLLPYTAPEDYCNTIMAHYPHLRQVILTLDKDGSMVCDRTKGKFFSPKPQSVAVSTVGAGDAFSACYLYHHLLKHDIPTCLTAATLLSDYVVTKLGAVPELPEELKKQIV